MRVILKTFFATAKKLSSFGAFLDGVGNPKNISEETFRVQ